MTLQQRTRTRNQTLDTETDTRQALQVQFFARIDANDFQPIEQPPCMLQLRRLQHCIASCLEPFIDDLHVIVFDRFIDLLECARRSVFASHPYLSKRGFSEWGLFTL